jgi:predicted dehydrogenase
MTTAVAVLGLGSIGLRHARNLLTLGRPVIGFDPDAERRAALEQLGGRVTSDRAAAFAGADAVVIASPNDRHLDDLASAVEHGLPTFVEKPLAHDPDGVAAVLDAADARGLVVFAALNLRYHPAVRAARAALERGEIGAPLWSRLICASWLPSWRPHQDYRTGYTAAAGTGGVLFDIVHEFDLATHLLGPARTVACAARRSGVLDMAAEDCADVILAHAGGVQSSLHLDYVTRPRRRVTEIAGTTGFLEIDLNVRTLRLWDADGALRRDERHPGGFDDDYVQEMAAFLACLDGTGRPACDGREALGVLRQVVVARALAALPTS